MARLAADGIVGCVYRGGSSELLLMRSEAAADPWKDVFRLPGRLMHGMT